MDNTASFVAPAGYSMLWKHGVSKMSMVWRGVVIFGSMAIIMFVAFILLLCSKVQSAQHAEGLSADLIEDGAEHICSSRKEHCIGDETDHIRLEANSSDCLDKTVDSSSITCEASLSN